MNGTSFFYIELKKGEKKMTTQKILSDPSIHTFTKNIITEGLTKDPVDAYYDALLAVRVLKDEMEKALT
jgi:hypothetical protein